MPITLKNEMDFSFLSIMVALSVMPVIFEYNALSIRRRRSLSTNKSYALLYTSTKLSIPAKNILKSLDLSPLFGHFHRPPKILVLISNKIDH